MNSIILKRLYISILIVGLVQHSYSQLGFTEQTSLLENQITVSHHAIGVADMNNDGKDDLVRMSDGLEIIVDFQQAPNQDFVEWEMGTINDNSWGLAIADVNNDMYNDIVVGGFLDGVKVIHNLEATAIEVVSLLEPIVYVQGINFFDVNNDGLNDIFACDDLGVSDVFMNMGNGTYVPDNSQLNTITDDPSDNAGNYGSCFVDIDNNGHCDLYIAKCAQGVTDPTDPRRINLLFTNDGEGGWQSEGVNAGIDIGYQSWSADFGDYDNDGDMDVVMAHHDNSCTFFENDGTGVFTDVTEAVGLSEAYGFIPYQSTMQDFDNNGWIDILFSGGLHNSFCMNNGDGTFTVTQDVIDHHTNSHAIGDLNSDGYLDLLVTPGGYGGWDDSPNTDAIYFNDGGDRNYLRVELQGTESNLNGVGSRIIIESEMGSQIRDVKGGESYGISNSLIQHFGIGNDTEIMSIVIHWASGLVESFEGVNANQQITLVEGDGEAVGINDHYNSKVRLEVYPVPSSDQVNFLMNGWVSSGEGIQVTIYNVVGEFVESFSMNSVSYKYMIPNSMNAGVYIYSMNQDGVDIKSGYFVVE